MIHAFKWFRSAIVLVKMVKKFSAPVWFVIYWADAFTEIDLAAESLMLLEFIYILEGRISLAIDLVFHEHSHNSVKLITHQWHQ